VAGFSEQASSLTHADREKCASQAATVLAPGRLVLVGPFCQRGTCRDIRAELLASGMLGLAGSFRVEQKAQKNGRFSQ